MVHFDNKRVKVTVNVKRTGLWFELSNFKLCKYSVYFSLYPCFLPSHCQITHQIEIQLIIGKLGKLYWGEIFSQNFLDEGDRETFYVIKVSHAGKQAKRGICFSDSWLILFSTINTTREY